MDDFDSKTFIPVSDDGHRCTRKDGEVGLIGFESINGFKSLDLKFYGHIDYNW